MSSPMFISIGTACNVKHQIQKHIGPHATLFFDWLMVDMSCVNTIFSTFDIDKVLHVDYVSQNSKDPVHSNHARMDITSLSFCQSIHDFPVHYNSTHIEEFIKKYKRRYYRIIDYIFNHTSDIYFIRCGAITPDEKHTFIKNIKRINPKCAFTLVELINQEEKNDYFVSEDHFMSFNVYNYKINQINKSDWTTSYWDWKRIFRDIRNL